MPQLQAMMLFKLKINLTKNNCFFLSFLPFKLHKRNKTALFFPVVKQAKCEEKDFLAQTTENLREEGTKTKIFVQNQGG